MTVHFVYRARYGNPGFRHVRRFPGDTVLDWFRSVWKPIPEELPDWPAAVFAHDLVGRHVYSLSSLFERIAEHGWAPPADMDELAGRLGEALYVNEMDHGPHHVEILTDDDEVEMAIYVFDDLYATEHPERAAFPMLDGWELPDGAGDGVFAPDEPPRAAPPVLAFGDGATYFVYFADVDSGTLSDLRECPMHGRVDGVRLPDLPRYLFALAPVEDSPPELAQIVTGLERFVASAEGDEAAFLAGVRANPADPAAWAAYSDWPVERGHPPAGVRVLREVLARYPDDGYHEPNPEKDFVSVRPHVAQACKMVGTWGPDGDNYHHLILFDDRWAAAHPTLARSVLRFASRWDCL